MLTIRSVLSSIAVVFASALILQGASKDYHPGPASSYSHQSSDSVIIGAQVFDKPEMVHEVFGKKVDFERYGVSPVLVVIENDRKQTIDLRSIEVSLVAADGRHAQSVKPDDIQLMAGRGQHPQEVPMPIRLPKRKASIASPEISQHAFSAPMLAPGDSASGFFYFEAAVEPGDKLYVSGLQEAPSGKDIMFFEFPVRQ